MADIFGGVQAPAWLVEETHQTPGELGQIGGMALGGLVNAIQQDPATTKSAALGRLNTEKQKAIESGADQKKVAAIDKKISEVQSSKASHFDPQTGSESSWLDSRKGLARGLFESRMNIEDPLWRLKVEQSQANILSTFAGMENQLALARERKAETAAWMEDTKGMSAWLAATPEQREKMGVPTVKSKQGLTLIERTQNSDNNFFTRKEQNRIRQEQADNQNTAAKAINQNTKSFYDLLGTVDNEADRANILGLLKGGLPTQEAWAALSAAPKTSKEQAKTKGAIDVEKEKQKGRTALEGQREEGQQTLEAQREASRETIEENKEKAKTEFEAQRQKDRLELKKVEGDIKVDLEKMRLGGKDEKGRKLTEDDYVNRHFNTLFNAAWKEADVKDVRVVTQLVERTLRLRYRVEHKEPPKPVTASPAAGTNQTATATAPGGTNAPPAAATDKDPLGLFK